VSKDRRLKQVWGYEDTLNKIKSDASTRGILIKDYLDELANSNIPKKNDKKKYYSFP